MVFTMFTGTAGFGGGFNLPPVGGSMAGGLDGALVMAMMKEVFRWTFLRS